MSQLSDQLDSVYSFFNIIVNIWTVSSWFVLSKLVGFVVLLPDAVRPKSSCYNDSHAHTFTVKGIYSEQLLPRSQACLQR